MDGQFYNSVFDKNKVFEVQGDYGYLQCENACHNKRNTFINFEKALDGNKIIGEIELVFIICAIMHI